MVGRKTLAVLLTSLLAIPAGAASEIVGTILQIQGANVGGVTPAAGTTVFSGDYFDVSAAGSAEIALRGGGVVHLGAESRARLKTAGEKIQLVMSRGRARFRTTVTSLVEARLADATAAALGNAPAVGIVALIGPKTGLFAAEKGTFVVSTAHDGKSMTLREGESVTLTLSPAPPQPAGGAPALGGPLIATIAIASTVAFSLIFLAGPHDDPPLTDRQLRDAVSPFRLQ